MVSYQEFMMVSALIWDIVEPVMLVTIVLFLYKIYQALKSTATPSNPPSEVTDAVQKLKWAYGGYGGLLLWSIVVIMGFGIGLWEMLRFSGSYAQGFIIGLATGLVVATIVGIIVYLAEKH